MFKLISLAAFVVTLSACDGDTHVKPLTVDQNQQLIIQLSFSGFKRLADLGCYEAVATRITTNEWSDNYCAQAYGHLNYE